MRLGTKRYFCGGCGAVVDGPGQHCRASCLTKARASVIDANVGSLNPRYDGREPDGVFRTEYQGTFFSPEEVRKAEREAKPLRLMTDRLEEAFADLGQTIGKMPIPSYAWDKGHIRAMPLTPRQSVAVAGAIAANAPTVEDARDAMIDRQRNRWKTKRTR